MSFRVRVFTVDGQKLKQAASWKEGAPVQSIAYSSGGALIAVGDLLGVVHVYDANKPAAPLHTFRPDHDAPALALAFSKTSGQLAIGRGDRHITIHRFTSASTEPVVLDQEGRIAGLAFAFSDRILMAAGDQRIRTWDFNNLGSPPGEMAFPDRVHSFVVTEDGLQVVVGLSNGEVHVASSRNPQDVSVLRGHESAVKSLALRGSTLVSGAANGTVLSWSLTDETLISAGVRIHSGIPSNATFAPSGDWIAAGDSSGRLALWNRPDNRLAVHTLSDQLTGIDALAFSADARLLAIGSEDSGLLLWDVAAGHALRPVDKSLQGTVAVAFGRNTAQAVAIKADGATALIRIRDGNVQTVAPPNAAGRPMSYAADPEHKRLAVGTNEGYAELVDLETGRYIGNSYRVKTSEVMGIAFLDATHLVGALTDGNIFVWDSSGVDAVRFVATGSTRLTALAHAPTSHRVAVGNNDGVIQLLDTHSWQRVGPPLQAHKQSVQSVAFASNGVSLVSNSNDGQLKVWNVDPKNLAGVACWVANRQLDRERAPFDLRDAGDCAPADPATLRWRRPMYPEGLVPVAPKAIEAVGVA
jgi:WD40 repeat protein